jgi:Fe-S-cluster-containing dehydrogenase component
MRPKNKNTDENQQEDQVSRRDFLKIAGAMVGAATLTQIASTGFKKEGSQHGEGGEHRWGMAIDINLCIGCNYCTYACQAVNNLSDNMIYNVVTTETMQNGEEYFLSRPCMQCDDPPCVHVCPVGATYVRDDGIVAMDYDLCIGCRYCEVACPYDVRVFNWREHTETSPRVPAFGTPEVPPRPRGVMEKCTFCQHRIDAGLERGLTPGVDDAATPACVVACPTGARIFGDLNDPSSPVSEALHQCKVPIRLREELSTSPHVFYLPPRPDADESVDEG